jgi:hypothetical protein
MLRRPMINFSYSDYPALGLAALQGFLQQIWLPVSVKLLVEGSCPRYDRISCIKDTVQPKKRGVKRGINRFVPTSYTIADVF